MTFVVHISSTLYKFWLTSEPCGRYTSRSPFTFIEDSSLHQDGSYPSLQSLIPEWPRKKPVTIKQIITVITGALISRLLLFMESVLKLNLLLPSIFDISVSFAEEPIDLTLDIAPPRPAMMVGVGLTASIPLLVGSQ